ncbi:MAG: pilus assembly PilX family protein [Halomonas sp.]|uniref:pilus assembly PilX family protein n=1 Tax=Halomonas sp. TaxID=1486246 RepID=UPI003F8DE16A
MSDSTCPIVLCRELRNEGGMALLVVLVMLVLIGLIAVVGAQEAQLQTRMSANSQYYAEASHAAESLLIRLERRLENNLGDGSWMLADFRDGSVGGLHSLADGSASGLDPLDQSSWSDYAGTSDGDEGRFVIEYLGRVGPAPLNDTNAGLDRRLHAFRLTVQGETKGAFAVTQSEVHLEAP